MSNSGGKLSSSDLFDRGVVVIRSGNEDYAIDQNSWKLPLPAAMFPVYSPCDMKARYLGNMNHFHYYSCSKLSEYNLTLRLHNYLMISGQMQDGRCLYCLMAKLESTTRPKTFPNIQVLMAHVVQAQNIDYVRQAMSDFFTEHFEPAWVKPAKVLKTSQFAQREEATSVYDDC